MTWVKLDDDFIMHRKVMEISNNALALYIASLTHCAKNLTDGFVSEKAARQLAALRGVTRDEVEELLAVRLWEDADGGYIVHDFLDYNYSKADAEQLRQERSESGKVGGQRSGETRRSKSEANREATASIETKQNGSKSEAVPGPVPGPVPVPIPIPEPGPVNPNPPKGKGKKTSLDEYPEEFEAFWGAYPRKEKKVTTFKLWRRLTKEGINGALLIKAAESYAVVRDGEDIAFTMYPSTFLGIDRRFEAYMNGPPPKEKSNGHMSVLEQSIANANKAIETIAAGRSYFGPGTK